MKTTNIILVALTLVLFSCKHRIAGQDQKTDIENHIDESDIYFASKRINECFSAKDPATIEYITQYLDRDSIKVRIAYSSDESMEAFYLSGAEKIDFFKNPEIYTGQRTRRKSEYYNVKGNCYEFNNEGISHNSIYLKKLCYAIEEKGISLIEIYLLDGD